MRKSLQLTAYVLILAVLWMPANAQNNTQEVLYMSLQEAVETAQAQNFSVRDAAFEERAARSRFSQTNAVFLPAITFEYDIVSTNDPLNVFGFKLKQELVTQQDFDPAQLNDPGSYENYSARFSVQQPVFNPDMLLQRSAARSQLESTREQLSGTKSHVRFQVTRQYYELVLFSRQLVVIEEALETAREYERQAQNFYNEGFLSREDFLSARVHRFELESQKIGAVNNLEDATDKLAYLLGYGSNVTITPTDELAETEAGQIPDVYPGELNVDNAYLRAISHQADAAGKMARSSVYSFIPKINLFGQYEFNDPDFAGFDASSYMIGANLTWNIFSGYQKAGKVSESRVRARQAETMLENQTIDQQNQLESAWRSLGHARQQIEVSREAIEQASENARIRGNRYAEGMAQTTDLLQAETKLSEARLNELMAIFRYNMSIAAIEMLLEL